MTEKTFKHQPEYFLCCSPFLLSRVILFGAVFVEKGLSHRHSSVIPIRALHWLPLLPSLWSMITAHFDDRLFTVNSHVALLDTTLLLLCWPQCKGMGTWRHFSHNLWTSFSTYWNLHSNERLGISRKYYNKDACRRDEIPSQVYAKYDSLGSPRKES